MSLFDRQVSRVRSVVGQYLTRDAAHPAADQWANETLAHAFEAAHRAAAERQLIAIAKAQPVLPPGVEERLLEVLRAAQRAMPFVDVDYGTGDGRGHRMKKPAASMLQIKIGEDHLPDFAAPAANQRSERLTFSETLLAQSCVLRAGARLLAEPKSKSLSGKNAAIFQRVPTGLIIARPAPFRSGADPEIDPAVLTPLASIIADDQVERPDDLANYSFRVSLKRREILARPENELMELVLWSITQGLARAVDAELLGAIAASSPQMFSLGRAAAKGVRFGDLRALVGTSETGVGNDAGPGYGDAAGGLFVHSVPAELCAAATDTVIGDFGKFGVALGGNITVVIERTAADGSTTLTCWAAMRAVLPDAGYAWSFQPPVTP